MLHKLSKKGLTLIEIIIVLVLIGLIGGVITDIISNTSKRYIIDYQYKLLDIQTENYIHKLNNLFKNIIPNTVIGDKCKIDNDDCYNGNYTDFDSLKKITQENKNSDYPVIEFYKELNYLNYFEWDKNKKENIPLSSKFVDLKNTQTINYNNNEYKITVRYSDLNKSLTTLNQYLKANNINENSSDTENTVLLMSGAFNNGDILDINNSYGYKGTKSVKLFKVLNYKHYNSSNSYNSYDILDIEPVDNLDGIKTEPYQTFFIVNSGYALVPKKNKNGLLDIYLFQFYKPWKGDKYKDAQSKVLFMTNLTKFEIKSVNNSFFVKFCKEYPEGKKLTSDLDFTVCKTYFKY